MAEPRSPGGPRPEVTLTPVDFDPFAEPKETVGLPLTDEQAEVWSAAQMGASASCSFNQCFTVALRGELSVGALEKALHRLVERHEALRARFDPYGRGQTIVDGLRPSLPMKDLSSLPAEERAREVAGIILREGEEPFDLANGPLFRAQLLRTGVDEHRLVFTAHHIVCDGWSSGLLLRDLGALYSAERNGTSAALPAAVSYRDYLRQMATPEEGARQRAAEDYWASRFADSVPVVELPLDRPRPTVMSYRGGQENASLPASSRASSGSSEPATAAPSTSRSSRPSTSSSPGSPGRRTWWWESLSPGRRRSRTATSSVIAFTRSRCAPASTPSSPSWST